MAMTAEETRIWKKKYAQKYYQEHKEEIIAASTKYHEEHREEVKARNKVYQPKYRVKNFDRLAEVKRQFAADHPEYQREWHAKHPGKRAKYRQDWIEKNALLMSCCRKAAWANLKYPGRMTGEQVVEVLGREDHCHWCKKKLAIGERTLEHLKPINDLQFLTVACALCNSRRLQGESDVLPEKTAAYNKEHAEQRRKRRGLSSVGVRR